ncbi:MAG: DNA repair protein RecN, partial [Rhodocyclaceae bacterium]|nr:DNA repair protein RecN [Rhodocyclaceae bacterium]
QNAWAARAAELTARRQTAAQALSVAVTEALQTLALAGSRFAVQLVPNEPAAHGQESVLFQVAANAGQELRPLAKVASGGELSRIGLAIQVLTSRSGGVPTLIFDEVDAGIGGRVAEIVGQHLAALGRERQVMCVTHLPQVAARAQWQYHIAKEEENGQTRSRVQRLDDAGRVEEIARMLGGVRITQTTRQHAAEMLAADASAA